MKKLLSIFLCCFAASAQPLVIGIPTFWPEQNKVSMEFSGIRIGSTFVIESKRGGEWVELGRWENAESERVVLLLTPVAQNEIFRAYCL